MHNSSTLSTGPFSGQNISGRAGRNFTKDERNKINKIGRQGGCHSYGSTESGTKSGNFIVDHQPPISLNKCGSDYRFYPHCISCNRKQGGEVNAKKRRKE